MKRYVIVLCVLLTLISGVAVAIAAHPASVKAASNRPQEYLALGDSVAFGYSPLVVYPPSDINQYIGYPNDVAAALKENLTNSSCPGETSSHFINLASSDNGCGPFWQAPHFLHAAYITSQLDFTDSFLQSHPQTLVISIDIGANDLFVLQRQCGGAPDVILCIESGLPVMLGTLAANLDTIYGHIRNVDGYQHKIVALTYYSLNYSDPVGTAIISQVNNVVAARTLAWGGVVADGFGAFQAASAAFGGDACAAGLLVVTSSSPLTCNIHPSLAGHDLLAQAIVNALRPD